MRTGVDLSRAFDVGMSPGAASEFAHELLECVRILDEVGEIDVRMHELPPMSVRSG
jgi:hypothetical protein